MYIKQVDIFFREKEYFPCPLTEKLVKAGYQQTSGGYIERAKKEGLIVNYKQNSPSQYWHLMTYCNSRDMYQAFNKSIVCGELIFWMAEVSECVPKSELEKLADEIIASVEYDNNGNPVYDRKKWNKEIQNLCFDRLEPRILTVTDEEFEDYVFSHKLLKSDLTKEQLNSLRAEMELIRNGGVFIDCVLCDEELNEKKWRRRLGIMMLDINKREKLREMIARCHWTFAKTMPNAPHEYIVRDKCELTDDEFLFFVDVQRNYGKVERWGKYTLPYLYVGNYKYWTMGAPHEDTIIINRAEVEEHSIDCHTPIIV